MIQSFDWRTLQVVQKEAPEIRTMYLSSPRTLKPEADGKPSPWLAGFAPEQHGSVPKAVKAAGGKIWAPNQTYLTPELLAEARALGHHGHPVDGERPGDDDEAPRHGRGRHHLGPAGPREGRDRQAQVTPLLPSPSPRGRREPLFPPRPSQERPGVREALR